MEILTQIRPVDIRNYRASRDQTNGSRSSSNLHGVEMKVMGFLTILPSLRVSSYNLAGDSGQAAKLKSCLECCR